MSVQYSGEPMLEMYLFETNLNIEQLEMLILETEKSSYTQNAINEIFRIMHTVKGASAMMLFNNISGLAHSMEDLFYFLREQKPSEIDDSALSDLVLDGVDFIKLELQKIKDGQKTDGDNAPLLKKIEEFIAILKETNHFLGDLKKPKPNEKPQYYISANREPSFFDLNYFKATILFEDGCEMENLRAYTVVHNLQELTEEFYYLPSDIIEDDNSTQIIKEDGFQVFLKTDKSYEEVNKFFNQTIFLKELTLTQLDDDEEFKQLGKPSEESKLTVEHSPILMPKIVSQGAISKEEHTEAHSLTQSFISVNVEKLDILMNLVGEMVIAEAMVTQNPDLKNLELDNFQKAARQLHKINSEIQDMVMSIRMVPLASTFQKMHRVVRDMSKKLEKEVQVELIGEDTEVDKNIIEHISDPLMHLVRNSIDHGLERAEEREVLGKARIGKVTLEAKHEGSDVLIIVKDDGKGLNKDKILERARDHELLVKAEQEMTEKEIFNLIFLPGFSTKENISEFSGRGVGMDVVTKNIGAVGGSVSVDSLEGTGTTIILKIPLTLAIIDGMNVKVGSSCYTIPTTAIKESFRPKEEDLIHDLDGNEMIMVRGECYPIFRLHEFYHVTSGITDFQDGILIMVEQEGKTLCLFSDELLGQQQVVVKALPNYIRKTRKVQGLAGCTLLGDGSISLILDIGSLIALERG